MNYTPPLWAKNGHTQTLLTSSPARKYLVHKRSRKFLRSAEEVTLTCVGNIKLQGFYNKQANQDAPLVILIHGWEGCADSTYIVSAAHRLHGAGFATFRLNLRDHGDTHHLNEEIFNFCHLEEVIDAIGQIHARYQPPELYLSGFSLGGNFSLRVAAKAHEHDLPLKKVVAICAPMNPHETTDLLNTKMKVYNTYFMRKWKSSLRKKAKLFPERYGDIDFLSQRDLWKVTQGLLPYMPEFQSVKHYFDGYTLTNECLANVQVPTTVLLAKDDPIIDHRASERMTVSEQVSIVKTQYGGHCGFFKNRKLEAWVDDYLVVAFTE